MTELQFFFLCLVPILPNQIIAEIHPRAPDIKSSSPGWLLWWSQAVEEVLGVRTRIKHLLYPFELKSLNNLSSPRVQSDQPRLKTPTHRTRPGERKAGPESIKKPQIFYFLSISKFLPIRSCGEFTRGSTERGSKITFIKSGKNNPSMAHQVKEETSGFYYVL